ncbi:iron ABC transporter substrate-binding protein [Rhodobacteraceae bacterium WD3A24]|nr:iron ABC transporter substrate-binding protein [Rhodobacteraceae bacterium WD3A24]
MMKTLRTTLMAAAALAAAPLGAQELTLYSGRGETLVAPIIDTFTRETGIEVNVRYGGTAELAILLQEEDDASPADLYWAQDVAALGTVAELFAPLPDSIAETVDPRFRDSEGRWIGTSGRARVLIYSTERMSEEELPDTMAEAVDDRYEGRIAVPPTNGSFLAHVTALRHVAGDDFAREWLGDLAALDPVIVRNNTAAHQAIANGEADFAITNNYYLSRFLADDADFPVRHAQFEAGDIGNLLMTAGIGVLESSDDQEAAFRFVEFLLSPAAQQYFTGNVYEFPLAGEGIPAFTGLGVTYQEAQDNAPDVDLNALTDLEGTLEMMRDAGLL